MIRPVLHTRGTACALPVVRPAPHPWYGLRLTRGTACASPVVRPVLDSLLQPLAVILVQAGPCPPRQALKRVKVPLVHQIVGRPTDGITLGPAARGGG